MKLAQAGETQIMRLLFSLAIVAFLASCSTGRQYTKTTFHGPNQYRVPQIDDCYCMYTRYFGESRDFNYSMLGYVKVDAPSWETTENIKDQLMYEAHLAGANAVIDIKDYKILDQYRDSTRRMTGVAVKIPVDSAWVAQHGYGEDMVFVAYAQNHRYQSRLHRNQRASEAINTTIAVGLLTLGVIGEIKAITEEVEEEIY